MEERLKAVHTANAGVLLQTGKHTLGIDMFSRDPDGLYCDTPPHIRAELLERIEKRKIETLLFTHEHGDHFCLEDVLEALRRNPKLHIISTIEVIRRIREEGGAQILTTVVPEGNGRENVRLEIPGFRMELFYSAHMGEQYADVPNLVCMIEAGGRRILIPGDAWPKPELFERIALWSENIDWMIAPFPLIGIPSTRKMIAERLRVERILALHLPRAEADTQGWIASAKRICEKAQDGLPRPEFGEELGTIYTLPSVP